MVEQTFESIRKRYFDDGKLYSIRSRFPKLAEMTEKVVYGEVWVRPELNLRDRSMITMAALIAQGNKDQLRGHLTRAVENGLTEDEICEMITHLAIYTGWPNALAAAYIVNEVFDKAGVKSK